MKRFYKLVAVDADGDGWRLLLDGRPIRTPAQNAWLAPSRAVAEAAAAEWDAQGETVDPKSMPVTQFVGTCLDRVTADPRPIIDQAVAYGGRDLLCYRADGPADLVAEQAEHWDPLLDWAAETTGARLVVTSGILPVDQPAEALSRLRAHVEANFAPLPLTALAEATTALGSLVLALALLHGRLEPDEAFDLSRLDEAYQERRWGQDAEAAKRADALREQIRQTHRVARLAADG